MKMPQLQMAGSIVLLSLVAVACGPKNGAKATAPQATNHQPATPGQANIPNLPQGASATSTNSWSAATASADALSNVYLYQKTYCDGVDANVNNDNSRWIGIGQNQIVNAYYSAQDDDWVCYVQELYTIVGKTGTKVAVSWDSGYQSCWQPSDPSTDYRTEWTGANATRSFDLKTVDATNTRLDYDSVQTLSDDSGAQLCPGASKASETFQKYQASSSN